MVTHMYQTCVFSINCSVVVRFFEATRPRAFRRIRVGGWVHRVNSVCGGAPRLPPLGLPSVPLVLLAPPLLLADATLLDLAVLLAVILVALLLIRKIF